MTSVATDDPNHLVDVRSERATWRLWIGSAIVIGVLAYIVTSSMSNTVHYFDVHEARANPALVGETIRLRGTVVPGSHMVRHGELDEHLFILTAGDETVTVQFSGALPDQFQDRASIIATGELEDRNTFRAESLTAQCPSRYEAEPPGAEENPSYSQNTQ
ncbi:MAG: cytochrome c maturation protein CcmE [Myxococcales bacterium]|nr:cytochrome c maturation protein CcmE [Myxococcales bacterium]